MRGFVLAGTTAAAVCALAAFVLVALVHVDDNFHVDHVAGARLGLVAYALDGTFYPPLHADGFYGGTRYMPLGIGLDTLAARIGGDALVAAKLLAMTTLAALLAVAFALARTLGAGRFLALGAVGAIVATPTALFAGTTIYGDVLAVALQLGAITLVAHRPSRRAVVGAGLLAALAFTAKLTALWGLAAVVVWLVIHDRRRLPAFAAAALATAVLVLGIAELVSQGRLHDNLLALSGADTIGLREVVGEAPEKAWNLLRASAPGTLLLLPIAAAVVAIGLVRRQPAIADVALIAAAAMTLVVMSDVGAGFNHLLDLAVLVPLVVAGGCARPGAQRLAIGVTAAVVLAIAISLLDQRKDVREAAMQLVDGETPHHLRPPAFSSVLTAPVFSEDPTTEVQRGRRPVALDSYMLLRILREHPAWRRELADRFQRREFASVVLIADLDLEDPWWSRSHLGIDVARAIDANYRLARRIRGPVFAYRLLVPHGAARTAR